MLGQPYEVYLANFAVDMRKAINGLSVIVLDHFDKNPSDVGAYYVFCNRARNRMKVLYWDKNGFALWFKRLEKDRFKLKYKDGQVIALDSDQFQWLLSGLEFQKLKGHKPLRYTEFA